MRGAGHGVGPSHSAIFDLRSESQLETFRAASRLSKLASKFLPVADYSTESRQNCAERQVAMTIRRRSFTTVGALLLLPILPASLRAAQAPAPAATTPSATRQIGTIDAITPTVLTLTTDKGEKVSVTLLGETKVVQLAAGSTDLKTAQPATMADLSVGDRVLAVGAPAEGSTALAARRLVLMKCTDITKRHEAEQMGWQHGTGGLVSAVDAASGMVTITSGMRTISIVTTAATILRRYAPNSVRFEDATRSTLAELHAGDQLRVRGERASDGSIKADEIVSGSFRHLSGLVQSVDTGAGQVTVKDLKTQKSTVLSVTAGTAIHQLPPDVAARFATRAKAGGTPAPASAPGAEGSSAPRAGGADLSQVVSRLPAMPLSELKVGETIMVVGGDGSSGSISAITILSGVEAILAASPNGGAEIALSPWSMGGGEAGAGSQ